MDTNDDRGWVKPVDGEGAVPIDPMVPTGRTLSSSVIAGVVLVAVIAAAVVGTVIWRNRQGDPFASARSVPAGMDIVVTFDALALSDSEKLQAFVDAFGEPMVEAGFIDEYPDDLVAAIDDAIDDETGFTLSDDVFTWIGRSMSIAMSVPDMDLQSAEVESFDLLISVDVRNQEEAEAFVDKALDAMADEDIEVAAAQIGGMPGYLWEAEEDEDVRAGLVLTDDTLLVGIEDTIVDAIEARDAGLSIAEDKAFQDTMGRLPGDTMMSVYVAPSLLDGLQDLAEQAAVALDVEAGAGIDEPLGSMGVGMTLVDEGVRINYVMTNAEEQVDPVPDLSALAGLPDDTIGFFSVDAADAGIAEAIEALRDGEIPLDEVSRELGVDIVELLESFNGSATFAVTETRRSFIAETSDVPIGLVGALGLSDAGPMEDLLDMLEDMAREQSLELDRDGGVTTVGAEGQDFVSYSLTDDLFVVGTGRGLVSDVANGEGGDLLESDLYKELDAAVLGDGLIGYVDIERIIDLVPLTRDEEAVFDPIRGLGVGGSVSGDISELEVLLLVDY